MTDLMPRLLVVAVMYSGAVDTRECESDCVAVMSLSCDEALPRRGLRTALCNRLTASNCSDCILECCIAECASSLTQSTCLQMDDTWRDDTLRLADREQYGGVRLPERKWPIQWSQTTTVA
jgi:hypothetical protein